MGNDIFIINYFFIYSGNIIEDIIKENSLFLDETKDLNETDEIKESKENSIFIQIMIYISQKRKMNFHSTFLKVPTK